MRSGLLAYACQRLLVMIPTFFTIIILVFIILNLIPVPPPFVGGEGQSGDETETQRRFRETFNLDRPLLFNTGPWATTREVLTLIERSTDGDAPFATRLAATRSLEEMGPFAVPHLSALLQDPSLDPEQVRLVMHHLSYNARHRVRGPTHAVSQHDHALHRAIATNHELATLRPRDDASPEQLAALRLAWLAWYERDQARFAFSTGDRLAATFGETRLYHYLSRLLQGDFGLTLQQEPVAAEVGKRLKVSLTLGVLSLLLILSLSLPLGLFSALRPWPLLDHILTALVFVLYALPVFFVATLAVEHLPPQGFFPTSGFGSSPLQNPNMTSAERLWDLLRHIFIPVICISYGALATVSRYARAGFIEVINADHVLAARARGLPTATVIGKHILRNGMLPVLTLLGTLIPALLSGSVVVEYIFEIDGIGRYLLMAIQVRDFAVIMAILHYSALLTLVAIFLADLAYAVADPRITFARRT